MTLPMLSGPETKPISGNAPKQLIIFLHGLGADGHDLLGLSREFAPDFPDAHFVSPHAPFECDMAPMGYQWFSLLTRDPEAMLAGLEIAAPILNQFLDEQLTKHGLRDENMAVIGFSQGTMTALYTLLRRPNPCAAIVGFSGALVGGDMFDTELKSRVPTCLVHGDADMVVPFQASLMAEEVLKHFDVPAQLHRRPNLGHGIDMKGVEICLEFLRANLK